MTQEELIALIDIINAAEKDGIGLFDLKYHSFVRPLSGAYITYGKEPKLSLTKTNEIDGMKAFEVGNCRYCNSPYIIGKIQKKDDDQMDYLLQNKEIDIYENYGNEEFVRIDFFLLENAINEEEIDKELKQLVYRILLSAKNNEEVEKIFIDYLVYYSENKEDPILNIINSYWEENNG